MSDVALVTSAAAILLLVVALAATIVIAWRRQRAGRVSGPPRAEVASTVAASPPEPAGTERPEVPAGAPSPGSPESPRSPDPLADVDDLDTWMRSLRHEDDRRARYSRPVAVAIAELNGVEIVVDRFGRPAADRLVRATSDTLRRCARRTDLVARIGDRQFGVLLVETDEPGAASYVDRVRSASELWLEAIALPLQMRIGVASPGVGGTVVEAATDAGTRLISRRTTQEGGRAEQLGGTTRRMPGGSR